MPSILGNHWIIDVLDVSIVTVLFYKLYMFIRSTRAVTMFLGLLVLLAFGFLVQQAGMNALTSIIDQLRTIWLIGFLIVFQPELRRVLSTLGQNPIVRPFVTRTRAREAADTVVNAVFEMADSRTGALIVILGAAGLKGVIDTGTPLYARISEELLLSIFQSRSPLHDGAVILQGDQVIAAGCILPLTQDPRLSRTLGTRHRAAIGIAEESDVDVVVVSEETGTVSHARGGRLTRNLNRDTLRAKLATALDVQEEVA